MAGLDPRPARAKTVDIRRLAAEGVTGEAIGAA